jgi:hypothetical protein
MWKALLPGVTLVLGSIALGQGDNFCSNAQVISGFGPWAFDNTAAGLDGPLDCGGQPVRKDVWFLWTAPNANDYRVSTCGGTTLSTRVAVYNGHDCVNYPLISCQASNCAQQTTVSFTSVTGNEYLIRLGSRNFGESGSGTFLIELDPCGAVNDDGLEDNDTCDAAVPIGDGTYPNLFVSKYDDDWYEFDVPAGGTLNIDFLFTHASGDLDAFLFDTCGGTQLDLGFSANDNENINWVNPNACDVTVRCLLNHFPPDTSSDCNDYDMVVTGTGTTGNPCGNLGITVTCDPANNHTQGSYTKLDTSSLNAGTLHVEATDGPVAEFGYLLVSAQATATLAVSNGILCLNTPQGRYSPAAGAGLNSIGNFNAAGTFEVPPNSGSTGWDVPVTLPSPPGGSIAPGDTWYFQLWYRDGTRSNFSNAIQVDF